MPKSTWIGNYCNNNSERYSLLDFSIKSTASPYSGDIFTFIAELMHKKSGTVEGLKTIPKVNSSECVDSLEFLFQNISNELIYYENGVNDDIYSIFPNQLIGNFDFKMVFVDKTLMDTQIKVELNPFVDLVNFINDLLSTVS